MTRWARGAIQMTQWFAAGAVWDTREGTSMQGNSSMQRFGCERCWPESAEAAYGALGTLTIDAELIDESHFRVTIRSCPDCGQQFVSVFAETVDWEAGEDPQ